MKNYIKQGAQLILLKGTSVLLMERANTGFADGLLGLPSGKVEREESPLRAVIREAYEEVGVVLAEEEVSFLSLVLTEEEGISWEHHFFLGWIGYQEPENREPDRCKGLAWISIDDLPNGIIPFVRAVLIDLSESRLRKSQPIGRSSPGP
jgi:8-oxo-dGTP diphosphatase